jgi:hypothetical protein
MSKVDFLKATLPEGTRYSLRLIKITPTNEEIVRNKLYESLEELDRDVDEYLSYGWNIYYATAGFGAANNAKAENAVAKKEFYIDVDCGPGKPHTDKAAGLEALRGFCNTLKLPRPTIVDSGNGIHAHWVLDTPIPVHEWKATAEALKAQCIAHSFAVDHGCTADIVRVLRIPETTNFKGGNTVTLLTPVKLHTHERIKSVLPVPEADMFAKARELSKNSPDGLSELQKLIASNKTAKFETIWIKSNEGTGCAQIKHCIDEADSLPEPLWRAVLSIAQYCEDREWAIHKVSEGHPNYDPDQTETKAAKTKGPYTCESYQSLDRPDLCNGCEHKGKIKSPIQLGTEVRRAKKEDNKIEVEVGEEKVTYEIPIYPFPFFRGANGGIFLDEKNDEGDVKQVVVYPYDLYAFMRQRDPDVGDVVWFRCHLPNDGVREFMLPQHEISAIDKLRDGISREGVTVFSPKQLRNLQFFVSKQIEELQLKERAEEMHARFGWTFDDTFIVGDREYKPGEPPIGDKAGKAKVVRAPVSRALDDYVRWLTPKGSLDQWKLVANEYNKEAFDMHAFGVLAGFGSVLMHISPEHGGVINYYSKKSGTGKTTILKLANSIFGNPTALMKDARDTQLSKVHRMGLLNGIVCCVDEMTNIKGEEASNLLYGSTQGRGRDRMQSSVNAERANRTTWKLISLWSSNTSVEDKLGTIKVDPQGEMARLLEIHLETPISASVLDSQKKFNTLNDNYGTAGHVYLSYVLGNMGTVVETWKQVRDAIYAMQIWTQTERYRLNIVICAITGGLIAKSLGLIDYNIRRITKKAVKLVCDSSQEMVVSSIKAVETFAMFVNKNVNNMLIINNTSTAGTMSDQAFKIPKISLVIRYEPDTKSLFIVKRDFDKWCAEMYINAKEMKSMFKQETGKDLDITKKRMGKGWDADFGPVNTYEIKDANKVLGFDFADKLTSVATA